MASKKKYCKSKTKSKKPRKKTKTGKQKKSGTKVRSRLPRGYPSYCSKFLDYEPSLFVGPSLKPKPFKPLPTPSAPPLFVLPPPKPKPVKTAKPERKHQPETKHEILLPTKSLRRGTCERKYQEYSQGKHLGGGEFGEVFDLCHEQKCPYVIKVQDIFKDNIPNRSLQDFQQEVYIHRLAHDKLKIAPRIYDAWVCTPDPATVRDPDIVATGFIVMERMDGDLSNLPTDSLSMGQKDGITNVIHSQIDRLHQLGFEHRDIAFHNVFYKRQNGDLRFVLGDFGLARPIRQPRSKNAWDGDDDYKRLKEVDFDLSKTYRVSQSKLEERKELPQSYVLTGPQIDLPLPPLERYPEPSSLGYGPTIVPTAFDRPISQAKLEQKYKVEEEVKYPPQPLPTFLQCPSKQEYKKKLDPIPFPWQPYLQYSVQPKHIKDPLSEVWDSVSADVKLFNDEKECFTRETRKVSYDPEDRIISFQTRQAGGKTIQIYNDKPVETMLKTIYNNFLPFTSALNLVRVRAQANILKRLPRQEYSPLNPIQSPIPFQTSTVIVSRLRKFPIPRFLLPLLNLIANVIAEESINIHNWHLLSDVDAKIANRPAIDLVLFLYNVWFIPIKIDGIIAYSQSGLDMILERLKFLLQNRREAWGQLQKQIK